ncbi:MAG: ATP-binding protein [Calothrix sp. CSU_2_0]|nr:ATP-binding protein [Calothrix sp. CSU_2_0]
MDSPTIARIQFLQRQAASLLLYQSVLTGQTGMAFLELLQAIRYKDADARGCLQAYGNYFKSLASQNLNWEEYLILQILRDDNPFSRAAQKRDFASLPPALIAATQHDLQILRSLYECSSALLSEWVQCVAHLPVSPVLWYLKTIEMEHFTFPQQQYILSLQQSEDWNDVVEDLATYYRRCGTGLFAEYQALRWHSGEFIGIPHPDPIKLNELVGYESQKETLLKNTEFLLSGQIALNVLLYGSRGTGKSSLVKALLNERDNYQEENFANRGLRLIEVTKSELKDLPLIVGKLREASQKFIIFVDDLSFEEDDDAFKALKVVLEGTLTSRSPNIVVYATSNRRHLIREFFADRPAPRENDEVHAWDTMQEKLSFSDRFGLTLTFAPADQNTYLEIVRHLANQAEIAIAQEELEYKALQWATRHNGRSGRAARQFIDYLKADIAVFGSKKAINHTDVPLADKN